MDINVDIDEVLEFFGGRTAVVASALDTSSQNVCGWVASGVIPRGREYELQVKSGGKLVAESWDSTRDYLAPNTSEKVCEQ